MSRRKELKAQSYSSKKLKNEAISITYFPSVVFTSHDFYYWALSLSSFLIYLFTLYPTVSGGDSGELITNAFTLGIAHPPGYPLYLIMAHFFTWIPVGSIAWRVNLFSAFCSSISILIFSKTLGSVLKNPWIGILMGGFLAFSSLTWQYSVQAEVFSLNQLFVCLLLYEFIQFFENRDKRFFFYFLFTLGLGLSNHHTLLLLGVPLGIWMILQEKSLLHPKILLQSSITLLLGLLPYLYLLFAPSRFSMSSWGEIHNFETFLKHFMRSEYGTFQLGVTPEKSQLLSGLKYYLIHLSEQTFYLGPILLLFTLFLLLKNKFQTKIISPILIAFLFYLITFHTFCNIPMESLLYREVVARFWIQADFLVYFILGFGLYYLLKLFNGLLFFGIGILLLFCQVASNYSFSNQRQNHTFQKFVYAVLGTLPKNSILLSYNDTFTFPMIYFQRCEGFRTDIKVFDRELLATLWMNEKIKRWYPEVQIPGLFIRNTPNFRAGEKGGYTLHELLNLNYKNFPLFSANFFNEDMNWEKDFEGWPYGFINKLIDKSDRLSHENYLIDGESAIQAFTEKDFGPIRNGSQESFLWSEYWNNQYRWARALQIFANARKNDPILLIKTIKIYEYLDQYSPNLSEDFYYFAGDALLKLQPQTRPHIQKGIEYWEKFVKTNPQNDPRVHQVLKNLEEIKAQLPHLNFR